MSMGSEFKYGFFYNAFGKYTNLIIQLLITSILARFLTPSDFGVVAVVTVFQSFFIMLADMGIGPAIIQNKELNEKDINSIFSFSIAISIILGFIFLLLAYPISLFYEDSVYISVVALLSINVVFSTMITVPRAQLLKNKQFKLVNSFMVLSSLMAGIVGVTLAFMGFSYYSLVISEILRKILFFILLLMKNNLEFNSKIDWKPLREIYHFSKNQFLFSFVNFFSRNLDNLLIGRFLSPVALGFYNRAYTLALQPNHLLVGVISPVVQPILSDYQDDLEVIKKTYLKISKFLAIIGMSLSVFLFFSSMEIITFMFGEQWVNSVRTFQILSISVWIQMILSSTGAFFQSANRTDLLLKSGILSTILNVLAIVIGLMMGEIEYVALMLVISFSLNFLQVHYLLIVIHLKSSLKDFFKIFLKPIFIALLVTIGYWLTLGITISLNFLALFFNILIYLGMFILGLLLTQELKEIKKLFKR